VDARVKPGHDEVEYADGAHPLGSGGAY
jgi:hypothetical protein